MQPPAIVPMLSGCLSVGKDELGKDLSIYYEVCQSGVHLPAIQSEGPQTLRSMAARAATTRVFFIMGFAADVAAWYPLLIQLQRLWQQNDKESLEALLIDNRGIGRSSSPESTADYSTSLMARDALDVMDHLNWDKAHVVGFSMGGMIASKLASMAPHRVQSLTMISSSEGGASSLPSSWKSFKAFVKTIEERAAFDLKMHYTKDALKQMVPELGMSVQEALYEEYIDNAKTGKQQPEWAFKGQGMAVLKHSITDSDVSNIQRGSFPVWVIHGRYDIVASPAVSERLAARLHAPCVVLEGAHMIARENAVEMALLLRMVFVNTNAKQDMARTMSIRVTSSRALSGDSRKSSLNIEPAFSGAPVHSPAASDDPSSALMTAHPTRQKLN